MPVHQEDPPAQTVVVIKGAGKWKLVLGIQDPPPPPPGYRVQY